MSNVFDYDDSALEPSEIFEAIPAGKYQGILIDCSDKTPSKNGSGFYLKMTFEIISGEFKGRKVFQNYNLWHSKAETQEIARRQIKAMKIAVGLPDAVNPQELFNLPMTMKVKMKPAHDGYETSNEISGFAPKETPVYGTAPQTPAGGTQPAAPAAPAQPPWARK